jgi:antitoxin CptB
MSAEQAIPDGQLRWHARRGLQELDVLLQRYLDQRYPRASTAERMSFAALLEQNDADIMDWVLGRQSAPKHLTDVIRALGTDR